ncbi:MAG: L,D-transpeptidase family protein, partial [Phycisphaerales bacterium]
PPPTAPVELSMSRPATTNSAAIGATTGTQAGKPAIVDPTTSPALSTSPGTTPPTAPKVIPTTDPAVTPTTYTAPPAPGTATGGDGTRQLITAAQQDQAAGRLIEARAKLNKALFDPSLAVGDRGSVRQQISTINDSLVFSPAVAPGDTIAEAYTIKRGDNPTNIVRNQSLPIDQRMLVRVNNLHDPKGLRIGQRIKIFRTPFHAVVHKADHRLDLYVGSPAPIGGSPGRQVGPDGQEADWVFIRSFRVGLGEANGTPEGQYIVKNGSKLENPIWKNPRTGEVFAGGAPTNPIGKHWLGLEGVDDNTRKFTGYGIHGTIDPASIGQNLSMGCVRMMPEDVALVYEVLVDKVSTVKILP